MQHDRTRVVVEIGLSVALAAVLSTFKITLPWNFAGGSVSLAMLPIFVIGLRRGLTVGVVAGAAFGVVDYFLEPYFVHPIQVLLDYPVAFAACGLAALASPRWVRATSPARIAAMAFAGALLGGAGRFAASFASGIVFFGANAPEGQPVWLYSLAYNASYLVPSIVACGIVAAIVVPALERAVPVPGLAAP
ncbi:MAG: energy-coupled thiamine transporter ThiT [Coriobacteriia bacterium]|nr:energy-coupled thiamine transporter ThiT [Coriobacteriia bacterium]